MLDIIQRTIYAGLAIYQSCLKNEGLCSILATIDPSWSKFSTEKFTEKEMLFSERFQSELTIHNQRRQFQVETSPEASVSRASPQASSHPYTTRNPEPSSKYTEEVLETFQSLPPSRLREAWVHLDW